MSHKPTTKPTRPLTRLWGFKPFTGIWGALTGMFRRGDMRLLTRHDKDIVVRKSAAPTREHVVMVGYKGDGSPLVVRNRENP